MIFLEKLQDEVKALSLLNECLTKAHSKGTLQSQLAKVKELHYGLNQKTQKFIDEKLNPAIEHEVPYGVWVEGTFEFEFICQVSDEKTCRIAVNDLGNLTIQKIAYSYPTTFKVLMYHEIKSHYKSALDWTYELYNSVVFTDDLDKFIEILSSISPSSLERDCNLEGMLLGHDFNKTIKSVINCYTANRTHF